MLRTDVEKGKRAGLYNSFTHPRLSDPRLSLMEFPPSSTLRYELRAIRLPNRNPRDSNLYNIHVLLKIELDDFNAWTVPFLRLLIDYLPLEEKQQQQNIGYFTLPQCSSIRILSNVNEG